VGVHVRRCEQWVSISPFAQPSRYYEAVMKSFPRVPANWPHFQQTRWMWHIGMWCSSRPSGV